MRNGFLSCVVILAGFGVAAAQPYPPMPAMPFVIAPPPGTPYSQPPQPAMPYVLPQLGMPYGPQTGMPYGPQTGMPYGPSPAMPYVMPPPPGIPYAPPPGMAPPMPPLGMQGPMLPPAPPDGGPLGAASDAGADEGTADRPHLAEHLWVDADFILWWTKDARTPTLLTSGSPTDAFPGALGQPGTRSLFGGELSEKGLPGAHLDVGFWIADENGYHFGLDADFFYLEQGSIQFGASSAGTSVLAQPFFNVGAQAERAALLAFPGFQAGQYNAALSNRLWSAEVETRSEDVDTGVIHIDSLMGLRYLEFLEDLNTSESTTFTNAEPLLNGIAIRQSDRFAAGNFFYGAELGADGRMEFGPLSLRLLGKVAFGATHEEVTVSGSTTSSTLLGQSQTSSNGFLALPSNSGRYAREAFTIVPQGGVTIGYAVTKHIHATFGYTYLYDSSVMRPGDQIDHALNVTQVAPPAGAGTLVGAPRPAFPFSTTDYWAQGLNLGLEIRY